ncbi:MAG: retropepsin-like aspartic protease [Campylobacterota bacterium]|nr:retropepsin-like aspartic protease [Campylobacterota bacterium]
MPKKKSPLVYPYNRDKFDPPAPALEVSLTMPCPVSYGQIVKSIALIDSGADITVIPKWAAQQLQLRYVDEVLAIGYDGVTKKTLVYSVKIIFDNLGDFIIKTIPSDNEHILIGRDILNRWLLFLKGRNGIFEVS